MIIIIGILAAIAIPTFLAQRENAWESAAASDLRNAAAAATSCSAENDGAYFDAAGLDCDVPATLAANGFNGSEDVTLAATATANTWTATTVNLNDDGTTYRFYTNAPAGEPQGRVYCDAAVNAATGGADCT